MHTAASPCSGHDPLVFERGRCFRCGRLLASEIDTLGPGEAIPYRALAITVDRIADELRREAADAGYLDTPERYRHWLETRLAFVGREAPPAARTPLARPQGRVEAGVGVSVRGVLAPEVL